MGEIWLAITQRAVKASTTRCYRTHVRYLRPIASVELTRFTPEHVESVYIGLAARGVGAETISSVHRSARVSPRRSGAGGWSATRS